MDNRTKKALIRWFLVSVRDGGAGSGNFGHSGRPGEVGGSGKGGGKAYRTGSKEKGYKGVHKSEEFKGIAMHASASKDYHSFISSLSTEQKSLIKQQHKDCGTSESLQQYTQRLHKMLSTRGKKPVISARPKIAEGKDITSSFKWDKEKFPHEINAVLHEQGFDGPPRVVDGDEFDRIVKENPDQPLLFRSYTAPNKETLESYDKQLEGGDWYVDCSTGGAQYGQGMYCAGVYDHAKNPYWKYGVKDEMRHYRNLNENRVEDEHRYVKLATTTGITPPPYMNCNLDPDHAYKIPQDKSEWKDFDEMEMEPGDVYCIRKSMEGAFLARPGESKYTIFYAGDDDKFHFINEGGTVYSYTKDELSNKGFIEFAKCDAVPKEEAERMSPVSTTRRMTLDPSAKIITYDELKKEHAADRRKIISEKLGGVDPAPYIEQSRKRFLGSLTQRDVSTGATQGLLRDLKEAPEDVQDYVKKQGDSYTKSRFSSNRVEPTERGIREMVSYAAYNPEGCARNYPKFYEWAKDNPVFKAEIQRIHKKADDHAQRVWAQEATIFGNIDDGLPRDMGIYAAMKGYDAINAKGHGETGSYTVVVNRTKLIIDDTPLEVD